MDERHNLSQSDNVHLDRRFDEILTELRHINNAFPRGHDGEVDHDGHRRYHESLIKASEAQEQFWQDLRMDVIKKGVWAAFIIVLGLIVVGVQVKLGLTPKA